MLLVSEQSIHSEWVLHELRRARRAEIQSQRRKLFPIRLIGLDALAEWECPDSRTGSDLAEEVQQYFIPDFTTGSSTTPSSARLRGCCATSRPQMSGLHAHHDLFSSLRQCLRHSC